MMQKYNCPICKLELKKTEKVDKEDYTCKSNDDHIYIHRVKGTSITKIKVILTEPNNKLYMKISYEDGLTEVWTKSNNDHRTVIQTAFIPDFSDIEKLKSKIKTYLTFS